MNTWHVAARAEFLSSAVHYFQIPLSRGMTVAGPKVVGGDHFCCLKSTSVPKFEETTE